MPLCKRLELSHSVEIKTSPEKIWNFLKNPENYTIWHPKDHIKLIWTEGNRKVVFKFKFPVSLISPEIEWRIEPNGSNTVFTAISFLRAGNLYKKLFKKGMKKLIEEHNRHVSEEGENLKKILESSSK